MKNFILTTLLSITFSGLALSKDKSMIELKELLTLPVSAASGLLELKEEFYTISDDELKLYKITKTNQIESYVLISGTLPEDPVERKKKKPDFESLYFFQDKIFAMPSMSKKNRIKAASFDIKSKDVSVIDLTLLQQKASAVVDELNIEGSVIVKDELWLFQRGNGEKGINGIFKINPADMNIKSFQKIDLGKFKNHNLGFTDAVFVNDEIYFLAVVETTKSTYDDGKYLGAVLGKMNLDGSILKKIEINSSFKPEGLVVKGQEIFVVTDADNRETTSRLYTGKLPLKF